MKYSVKPKGVCSSKVDFEIHEGKIMNVMFVGGCSGNLQGIGKLTEGMDKQEVIEKLKGIRCGFKQTSCPDQLANALEECE